MTLIEAVKKWNLSPNWIRELIRSGRVKAKLRTDVPVPYYEIPDNHPKPQSMQRGPLRQGSGKAKPSADALRKRKARAAAKRAAVQKAKAEGAPGWHHKAKPEK